MPLERQRAKERGKRLDANSWRSQHIFLHSYILTYNQYAVKVRTLSGTCLSQLRERIQANGFVHTKWFCEKELAQTFLKPTAEQ